MSGTDDSIEGRYERSFLQIGRKNPAFPAQAKQETARMMEQIARTDCHLVEQVHTDTFNLDTILEDRNG